MSTRIQPRTTGARAEARAASGVVLVHACPRAVAPHVDWALTAVFGSPVRLDWAEQPIVPGSVRAETAWHARPGTGAALASALLGFRGLRFEVTEDASGSRLGERFAATPALGLFRADIGEHGDVLVHEERLRTAMRTLRGEALGGELARLLGTAWDDELEPFRITHDGGTVRVLHHVI